MDYSNVQLWFAKDENNNIITINTVHKEENHTYHCCLCGSEVIPRQGEKQSWCFAHLDKSKCNTESMYHWWYKNKFLMEGDKFTVQANGDKEYIVENILIEQEYKLNNNKIYKPDITIQTTTGETIYFEMDYSNKKKIENYIDSWIELGNIVVEIDLKTLMESSANSNRIFKALYYDGKCFNVKSKDEDYYDTIGKYKEQLITNKKYNKYKSDIEKLDWFWQDIQRYKLGEENIEEIAEIIQNIKDEKSKFIIERILKKSSCHNIIKDYVKYNTEYINNIVKTSKFNEYISYSIKIPHCIYDRLFNFEVKFKYKTSNNININKFLFTEEYINNLFNNIEKEIIEEKNITNQIEKIKEYVEKNYDYNNLCKYITLENEPSISEYKETQKQTIYGIKNKHNLYLNSFKSYYGERIKEVNKYEDVINIQELIKRKISYNTYKLFSKEDILEIDNVAKKLYEKFNDDDINITFHIIARERIEIRINKKEDSQYNNIRCDGITIYKDKNYYAINLYNHIFLLLSLKVNKIKRHMQQIKCVNSIIDNLNKSYKNNNILKEWHLKITSNNYISVYKNNRHMFFINIIKKYFEKNNKIIENNFIKKVNNVTKHEILEYIYIHREKRKNKYSYDLINVRAYKNKILKNLKESNFQITKIKPMCNKPYIILEYEKEISHIIFLSQHDYNNNKISLEDYDIVTILNKDIISNYEHYKESIKDYIIINTNEKQYDFVNRNQVVKSIIKNKIEENLYSCDKKINLFYYKSRPQNKKYRNLNNFNFVKITSILEFINSKYFKKIHDKEINEYLSELPYYISDINILEQKILNQQDIYNLFNLFFKTINTIQSNEINILLDIKYTNLENDGYKPWLIKDFIEETSRLGFKNINNTKGEII